MSIEALIDYSQIQAAAMSLVKVGGRAALEPIVAAFNVPTLKELDPEQYEAALTAIQDQLNAQVA